jgi:hypothetical protein
MGGDVRVGGRRCGQLRFAISAPELLTMACHCTGCQRMTGSAFSLSIAVPQAGFAVTAGEPVVGGLHGEIGHFHCPHCLSWVFTRPPAAFGIVNVRATMLDDARGFTPFLETFTSEKLPWVTTPAVHSFERFPANEEYPQLIAAYVAARAEGG